MIKQESSFSRLLHKKLLILNPSIYIEKTSNKFRRGVPDFYYEGKGNILWAEHKWIPRLWTIDKYGLDNTTSWLAQQQWLKRAYLNNKNTLVIIGIGSGITTMTYILSYPFQFNLNINHPSSIKDTIKQINSLVQ